MKNDYRKLIKSNIKGGYFETDPNTVAEVVQLIEALKESEEKYNLLQENIPIGLFQTTPDGKFCYVNKWVAKILGYDSPAELKSLNVFDLYVDPLERKILVNVLNSDGYINDTEVLLRCKDGSTIWVVINAKTIYNKDNIAQNYDGYLYNITERKKALLGLEEREEMFRAISQNLRSALYIFNSDGVFEFVNPAMYEITEYSIEELKQMKFYDIIHQDFREVVKSRGLERLKGKDVQKTYEFKILTKSKVEKWIEVSAVRLVLKGHPVVMGLGRDISDLKVSIEMIKKEENKYKTLYSFFRLMADNVKDMIWAKDMEGKYIFVNKAMCDHLLIAKDINEPIGKTDMFFAERERKKHPENNTWHTFGEICGNTDKVIMKSKKPERFNEYGNIQGKFLYLDVIKAPFWDENGKMIGTVGSARDVTKERQVETEHKRFESLQSVIYKIGLATGTTSDLKELIKVIRRELGKVIDTTNFYVALYEKEKDTIKLPYFIDEKDDFTEFPKGNSLTSLVIAQKKSMLIRRENLKELEDSGYVHIIGTPAKVWLGVPLLVKDEIIGALVIQNYEDEKAFGDKELELMEYVSSQISIAISQKQADEKLKESEKRLRQIIDTVPHMIFAKDKSGTFVLANKAMAKAYGLSVSEVEGLKQSKLHKIHEELKKFEEDDHMLFENNQTLITTEDKFTDYLGEEHVLHTIKIPMQTSANNGTGILGVAIDITERKKSEIELKIAKEKAEESDKLKTAFLANMSHEIRTPMNAILGFSELLNDAELSLESRKEFIRLIGESSKMLLNLIEDIIDIAKIEAEQMKIMKSPCHINLILDELNNYFTNELNKTSNSEITIKVAKGHDDPKFAIISDPLRFRQVMSNLIGNAVKFTDKGTVEFGYEILDTKSVQFFVKDTGIGLSHEKLQIIFERFRQAEESTTKEYGGTGLGLTIARKLIELLGGKIWVKSELHKGSTFYFTLPYVTAKGVNKMKLFTPLSDKHDWTGKTIVVAEDEDSNFELVKATLAKTNANVLWAHNGKEAVDLCLKMKVDLIMMDIRMPEMNGYVATAIIKARYPGIPVISLTAYAMPSDREKSLEAGCDDHISKPIKPNELIEKVSGYIEK